MGRLLVVAAVLLPAPGPLIAQQVATVEVSPARAEVVAGGNTRFRVVARDSAGRPVTTAPTVWLATPFDIAAADSTGLVTTFRPGRVSVFAIVGGKPGIAVLDIRERAPTRLAVSSYGGETTVVGGALQLAPSAYTEIGDPVPAGAVRWRSLAPQVATVSAAGLVTGRAPGVTTIVAEVGALSAGLAVQVRANPVRAIRITPVPGPVRTGDVVVLRARLTDAAGKPVTGVPVRWSVSGPGAAVYADGRFVASEPSAYPVTASVGDRSAFTTIQVGPRSDPRTVEAVAHVPLPARDVEGGEIWLAGDVAYVSTIAGAVYVFDIANPAAPAVTDSLIVDARLVNDVMTTADGRIGVLSREGASNRKNGLVFFDASDPRHPTVLSEFTETVTGGVHSAFVYEHYVFATDDATGSLRIIDFQDPRRPLQVGRWEVPRAVSGPYAVEFLNVTPERYLHDVYVRDGLAYLAYWRDGLVILDVGKGIKGGSVASPTLVSQLTYNHAELYPPGFIAGTHAVFPSGRYVFISDESYSGTLDLMSRERFTTRGRVHVIDVSDLERPRKVAEYDPVEFGAHNLWVENDLLYIGAYDGGIRVLDVSGELRGDLRAQGRVIGTLNTASLQGYRPNMALTWSAIPHRGHVFASDINSGLWVAKVSQPAVP
ncbi:MAG: Ig-like domain-containing protein [Gemmatimonadales bacterium]